MIFFQRRIFVLADEDNKEAREFFILGGTKGSTCLVISEIEEMGRKSVQSRSDRKICFTENKN